jgi:hypothetical protein
MRHAQGAAIVNKGFFAKPTHGLLGTVPGMLGTYASPKAAYSAQQSPHEALLEHVINH